MGFSKDYNDTSIECKLAVKYIYRILKKKNKYSKYKKNYRPPRLKDYTPLFLTGGRRLNLPHLNFWVNEKAMEYDSGTESDTSYSDFLFFRTNNAAAVILNDCCKSNVSGTSIGEILYEFPQEYFNDQYKDKKLPIKDRTFSLIFGLIFVFISCLTQAYLCYTFMPQFLLAFLIISISIDIFGIMTALLVIVNFSVEKFTKPHI